MAKMIVFKTDSAMMNATQDNLGNYACSWCQSRIAATRCSAAIPCALPLKSNSLERNGTCGNSALVAVAARSIEPAPDPDPRRRQHHCLTEPNKLRPGSDRHADGHRGPLVSICPLVGRR